MDFIPLNVCKFNIIIYVYQISLQNGDLFGFGIIKKKLPWCGQFLCVLILGFIIL